MQKILYTNARIATMVQGDTPYGLLDHGALATENGKIVWCGNRVDLPSRISSWPKHDLESRLITPGLIDCHTHVVHGGERSKEFALRLEGASYEEIARAGGGILSTLKATRSLSEDQLIDEALPRVDEMIGEGVTTLEIKSGYGLDIENEVKMLRAARRIGKLRPLRVKTSFLGAHAVPPEFAGRADAYIEEICLSALEAAHQQGLVDAVDGFCEGIAFSPQQIERVFTLAQSLGLPVKLHAEQLSNLGGARLAAKFHALSADHLEYLDEPGVAAMAKAGTIAVILPGAFYTLGEKTKPPVALFRKYRIPMAVATDCNPGSSPLFSILLTMNMACTLFQLTAEEALEGATRHAAHALGLDDCGTITAGKRADLAIWNVDHPRELSYRIGFNPLYSRVLGGDI